LSFFAKGGGSAPVFVVAFFVCRPGESLLLLLVTLSAAKNPGIPLLPLPVLLEPTKKQSGAPFMSRPHRDMSGNAGPFPSRLLPWSLPQITQQNCLSSPEIHQTKENKAITRCKTVTHKQLS
jgi:hypothetical protein